LVIGRRCTSPYQTSGWPFYLLPWKQNRALLVVGRRPRSSGGIALSIHPRQGKEISSWAAQSIPRLSSMLEASHPYPAIAIQLPRALSLGTFRRSTFRVLCHRTGVTVCGPIGIQFPNFPASFPAHQQIPRCVPSQLIRFNPPMSDSRHSSPHRSPTQRETASGSRLGFPNIPTRLPTSSMCLFPSTRHKYPSLISWHSTSRPSCNLFTLYILCREHTRLPHTNHHPITITNRRLSLPHNNFKYQNPK